MSWTRTVSLALFFLLSMLLIMQPASAQDSATGSIRGTVVDSSGAHIVQASIVVVSAATGLRYTATSDLEGTFAFALLPPGDYSARAVAPACLRN